MPCPSRRIGCDVDERGLYAVHGDAAHQFGEEVGGFLRHHLAGCGDVPGLFDTAGVEQEGDLGSTAVDSIERGGGFAFVGEIFFGGGRGERDAERGLKDAVVEQDDVEFALERRDRREKLDEIGARPQCQNVVGAAAGFFRRGISADGARCSRFDQTS